MLAKKSVAIEEKLQDIPGYFVSFYQKIVALSNKLSLNQIFSPPNLNKNGTYGLFDRGRRPSEHKNKNYPGYVRGHSAAHSQKNKKKTFYSSLSTTHDGQCTLSNASSSVSGISGRDKQEDILSHDLTSFDGKVNIRQFTLLKVLGTGSFAKVYMAFHNPTNNIYALKVLCKEDMVRLSQVERSKTERQILAMSKHPFIVTLYYAFQTKNRLYFALEYCPGGELFFHLIHQRYFSEDRAKFYCAEIVLALEHLHKHDIVYRDLKPENVLLDAEGHIRITDFGLSKIGVHHNSAKSFCGTPEYLAPEIVLCEGHGKAVDWWNLGVLMYEMLVGNPPFQTHPRDVLFRSIQLNQPKFPKRLSLISIDFIKKLLEKDPLRRLGGGLTDAEEVKSHPYFANIDWDNVYQKKFKPPFIPVLSSNVDVRYFDQAFLRLSILQSDVSDNQRNSVHCQMADSDLNQRLRGFTYEGSMITPVHN